MTSMASYDSSARLVEEENLRGRKYTTEGIKCRDIQLIEWSYIRDNPVYPHRSETHC